MDWMEKYEEEHRKRLALEQEARRRNESALAHFEIARDRLIPSINRIVAEVLQRTGVSIGIKEDRSVITVFLTKRKRGALYAHIGNHELRSLGHRTWRLCVLRARDCSISSGQETGGVVSHSQEGRRPP